jgi:hypothetical protein
VLNQNTSVTFGGTSNFALSLGDNVGPGPSANVRLGNTAGISATQTANTQFGGSVSAPIRVVTGNYTIADDDYTVLCNNAGGVTPIVISPPAAAASNIGRLYNIKRVNPNTGGSNDACVLSNPDGVSGNLELSAPGPTLLTTERSGVTLQSDGTQWWIVAATTGVRLPPANENSATGSQSTGSAVYLTLPGGPQVVQVVPESGRVLVTLTAEMHGSDSGNAPCSTAFMSVSIDGSIALDTNSLRVTGGSTIIRASVTNLLAGLIPGPHTFTAVYKNVGCGTGSTFNARQIIVMPD